MWCCSNKQSIWAAHYFSVINKAPTFILVQVSSIDWLSPGFEMRAINDYLPHVHVMAIINRVILKLHNMIHVLYTTGKWENKIQYSACVIFATAYTLTQVDAKIRQVTVKLKILKISYKRRKIWVQSAQGIPLALTKSFRNFQSITVEVSVCICERQVIFYKHSTFL